MGEPEAEESIGELIGRLVEDGKGVARAEIDYYRALAATKVGEARAGLILSLAPLVGPGLATLIVIVVALALAGLLGWLAYRHLARLFGDGS